ncbi:MAG: hypothetical protein LUD72_03305 [Bacteroidales bacterium]|nr:hypothetical protein [Bacteroidales bacterium]
MNNSHFSPISDEKKEYIRKHLNDRPRRYYAAEIGVSKSSFVKYVKLFGGEILKRPPGNTYKGLSEFVREHYHNTPSMEIAATFGCSVSVVDDWARKLGVKRDPKWLKDRTEKNRRESLMRMQTPEAHRKAAKKVRLIRKMEQRRVLAGLPQLTKYRVRTTPIKSTYAKSYLKTKYNYFTDPDDMRVIYYDKETRRHPRESYYMEKYGLIFKEGDE